MSTGDNWGRRSVEQGERKEGAVTSEATPPYFTPRQGREGGRERGTSEGEAIGFVTCGLVASVNVDDFLPSAPARIASVGQFSQRNVIRVTMDTETLDI